MRMTRLSQAEAEGFYAVHRARPFFGDLVKFMTSGPVVLMVLEGEDAIARNREVMGATDPAKAADGHDPQGLRHRRREEHRPRLGQPRERADRDRLLLPGDRHRLQVTTGGAARSGRSGARRPGRWPRRLTGAPARRVGRRAGSG